MSACKEPQHQQDASVQDAMCVVGLVFVALESFKIRRREELSPRTGTGILSHTFYCLTIEAVDRMHVQEEGCHDGTRAEIWHARVEKRISNLKLDALSHLYLHFILPGKTFQDTHNASCSTQRNRIQQPTPARMYFHGITEKWSIPY